MRTIVFFDLPNIYSIDKRNYQKFRKFLINDGFMMIQESVYSKLALNSVHAQSIIEKVKRNAPRKGVVQILTITEKQYLQIIYVTGNASSKILDTDERLVIL